MLIVSKGDVHPIVPVIVGNAQLNNAMAREIYGQYYIRQTGQCNEFFMNLWCY